MNDRVQFGIISAEDRDKIKSSTIAAPVERESLGFTETTFLSQQKLESVSTDIEKARKIRSLIVPTNDELVKLKLREVGEPACLFGEGKIIFLKRTSSLYEPTTLKPQATVK